MSATRSEAKTRAAAGTVVEPNVARPGRLTRSEDFERLLKSRSRAGSPHFVLHHVAVRPSRPPRRGPRSAPSSTPVPSDAVVTGELSTDAAAPPLVDVDERPSPVFSPRSSTAPSDPPDRVWYGVVVPKRHARRAVTRSLLKRQIRAAVDRHAAVGLAPGIWMVRLRAPFERGRFGSAASDALKIAARAELDALLGRAAAGR